MLQKMHLWKCDACWIITYVHNGVKKHHVPWHVYEMHACQIWQITLKSGLLGIGSGLHLTEVVLFCALLIV